MLCSQSLNNSLTSIVIMEEKMYRPNENENCGRCKYSYAPYLNAPITSKRSHLVACSLGRDILRTRESWCEDWEPTGITRLIWSEW
jgi:hypothetical protein